MSARWHFALVGVLALAAGTALWLAARPARAPAAIAGVAPSALLAASFIDLQGRSRSLGEFQGKLMVLNFWATWCAPCREEMPAFSRLQTRWAERGVQFVGVSAEEPEKVARFAKSVPVDYPLWTGGDAVSDLSRRLGNRLGLLPHTVVLSGDGRVLDMKVGPYTESELELRLDAFSPKSSLNASNSR